MLRTTKPSEHLGTGTPQLSDQICIRQVNLLGVRVGVRASLSRNEHQRRALVGLGAVTDPSLLDRLLSQRLAEPISDPVLWAETAEQPRGVVRRNSDGCTVTRLLEPPLSVDAVIVQGSDGRELSAIQDASLFASYTSRWVKIEQAAAPDDAVMEAKLCGVGLLGPHETVLLTAEPPTPQDDMDGWAWLLAEKAYRRWLKEQIPDRGTGNRVQATGGSNLTTTS